MQWEFNRLSSLKAWPPRVPGLALTSLTAFNWRCVEFCNTNMNECTCSCIFVCMCVVKVLSVVAQQIMQIQIAKMKGLEKVSYEYLYLLFSVFVQAYIYR